MCAELLQAGDVDLGLTPSIEYLHAPDYRFVPGIGIGSRGPVTSVAIFSTRPMAEVRTIALDTSSRTSVALTRVLCHDWFKIAPAFVPQGPSLEAMTAAHDAALLIGDPALEADAAALGLTKIDLGEAWPAMTGLPFVYAAWTGRAGCGERRRRGGAAGGARRGAGQYRRRLPRNTPADAGARGPGRRVSKG